MTVEGPFRHRAQMRFSDTDMMGHVNHARFLGYLEDARIGLLRSAGARGADLSGGGVILARMEIDYVRPLMLRDEPVEVDVWVERIGTSSVTLGYRLCQDGEVAARAASVLVAYDYSAGRSRPLRDEERAGLERHIVAVEG